MDLAATALTLERAGKPVFRIQTSSDQLGAEFFRWEFATAVAGIVLHINPFDEPDVRSAKERTTAQLAVFEKTGALRPDPPLSRVANYSRRESRPREPIGPKGRHVAILDYRPMDRVRRPTVALLRRDIRRLTPWRRRTAWGRDICTRPASTTRADRTPVCSCCSRARTRPPRPFRERVYTFSVLKRAQAFGDFEALAAAGRHVIHFHFNDPDTDLAGPVLKAVSGIGPRKGPRPDPLR